jgi:hypothetical protein
MDALQELSNLGLDLPTPAYFIGVCLFSVAGWTAYRRGRKISFRALTWVGLALMLFPYVVSNTWLLWVIGTALCGWVYFNWTD